jgi:aarF domain-containing kinase
MRSAFVLGRIGIRRAGPRCFNGVNTGGVFARLQSTFRTHASRSSTWRNIRSPRRILLYATANGAALGTAAFVTLSEKDNGDSDQTSEGRMLEASREEIEKKIDESERGFTRFRHEIMLFLDLYIREPICTGIRFLHLVVIFVPVIVTVPAIWIGRRVKERDDERTGTLWWYSFLVWSMEMAGPAFIKVSNHQNC